MKFLINHSKVIDYALLPLSLLISFACVRVFIASFFGILLTFIIWWVLVFIAEIIISAVITKPVKFAVKALSEDCDPYPLLNVCCDMLDEINGPKNRYYLFLISCESSALYAVNELEKMKAIIDKADMSGLYWSKSRGKGNKKAKYNCLIDLTSKYFMYYLSHNDEENILKYYNSLQGLKNEYESSSKGKNNIINSDFIRISECNMLIHENKYSDALKKFDSLGETDDITLLEKVNEAYSYGCAFVITGNKELAEKHLGFVVQYGNKLAVVNKAQQLLIALRNGSIPQEYLEKRLKAEPSQLITDSKGMPEKYFSVQK